MTHGILELELLSETSKRIHKIFEFQNLSIWSLSQDPRILESQDYSWTHRPKSLRIKETLEKTWNFSHTLLDPGESQTHSRETWSRHPGVRIPALEVTLAQLPQLCRKHLLLSCNNLNFCRDGELTICQRKRPHCWAYLTADAEPKSAPMRPTPPWPLLRAEHVTV